MNPDKKGSSSADACPDGIGSADWNLPLSHPKKKSAERHENNGDSNARPPGLGCLCHLQADWSADLKEAGKNEVKPCHDDLRTWELMERGIDLPGGFPARSECVVMPVQFSGFCRGQGPLFRGFGG